MAGSSIKSAAKANLLGKRNPEYGWKTKPILKEKSEEKEAAIRKKNWLYISNLSPQIEVSDIIDFFKDVGEVVHVRLVVDLSVKHVGYGYVEFASANEANQALQNKNGEFFDGYKIVLAARDPPQDKFCIDHKVSRRVSFPIEDETPSDFVEDILFVANLSPQTELPHIEDFFDSVGVVLSVRLIVNPEGNHVGYGFVHFASANQAKKVSVVLYIDFFKDVGEVVHVRLVVDLSVKHVGYGYVEFASANEANQALQYKNGEYFDGYKIFLAARDPPQDKFCIDHKVWSRDYLRQVSLPIDDETPSDFVEDILFVANLSPQTELPHIEDFFDSVGVVLSVRLIVNPEGNHVGYGFVQFASANQAKKALEKKNGEYLHDHKIFLDVAKPAPYLPRPKYNLAEMLCFDDYLRRENLLIEDDETPDFVEAVAIRKKTLFVTHISGYSKISDIINFFKGVGKVVHVRLIVNHKGKNTGFGFVEFASSNEAKNALEKKNGEYLHSHKINLYMARIDPHFPQHKWIIDHKVWYEDYLRRESLLIEKDEAVEGLDETTDFVEEVAVRKKTLYVANLSPRAKISDIISIFKGVSKVCGVRLIANHMSQHVGCGFVEFASFNEAKKVLQRMKGAKAFYLDVTKIAPYPLRPKYNLAEKLWYEDYLERESLLIEEDDLETNPNVKKQVLSIFCGKKTTFL